MLHAAALDTEDAIADADKEAELLIKPNQIKSVRIVLVNERWRCVKDALRGDNSHRSVDTFSQILSHVFSRVYSLAHTYQTQTHRHQQAQKITITDSPPHHNTNIVCECDECAG